MSDTAEGTTFWGSRAEGALFFVVCCLQTIPLLSYTWFVNWDGPSHVGSAYMLGNWNGAGGEVFRHYLFVDAVPMPNLTSYGILAVLLKFLSPAWAEKVLVAGLVIVFPAAVRYVAGAVRRDGVAYAYLAVPLGVGWFVHGGQYNFVLALTFGLFVVGASIRHRPVTRRGMVALSAALVVIYLTHLVGLAMTLVFLVVLASWDGWVTRRWDRLRRLAVAAVPSLALTAWWVVHSSTASSMTRGSLKEILKDIVAMKGALAVFSSAEQVVGVALVAALGLIGILVLVRFRRPLRDVSWGMAAVGVVGLVLTVVAPDGLGGGGYLTARLSLIPIVAGIAWIAQFGVPSGVRAAAGVVGVVAVVALSAMRVPYYSDFNRDFSEYLSVTDHIAAGSTVLPLRYVSTSTTPPGTASADYIDPIEVLPSWLISRAGAVDLTQYEAGYDYFPVQFQDSTSPFLHLSEQLSDASPNFDEGVNPDVDLAAYAAKTGGTVDYVITWGYDQAPESVRDSSAARHVQQQLAEGYELVFTSERGLLKLYRLRP